MNARPAHANPAPDAYAVRGVPLTWGQVRRLGELRNARMDAARAAGVTDPDELLRLWHEATRDALAALWPW